MKYAYVSTKVISNLGFRLDSKAYLEDPVVLANAQLRKAKTQVRNAVKKLHEARQHRQRLAESGDLEIFDA